MQSARPRFLLYSRPGCVLCDELADGLAALLPPGSYELDVVDVDADPGTRSRWGLKVPVLLLGDELVCHGTLDGREVHKALAQPPRPV
jgi:thioredoxin reductase (NADPH)